MSEANGNLAFSVSELTLSILEGFLAAASLHLGDTSPEGVRLQKAEPMQAWLALKSAGALMDQLAPVMHEDVRVPLHARLTFLFERLEAAVPQVPVESRTPPVASLQDVVEAAWKEMQAAPANGRPPTEAPQAPSIPGMGLPKRGSGLLFPPRGR
ncbi:hypothetical protein D3C72_252760 [compost metagenome]